MTIEQIITNISNKVGKNETYIKGQLTVEKNKLINKFGDSFSDERVEELALNTLLAKFELNKNDIIVESADDTTMESDDVDDDVSDDASDDEIDDFIEAEAEAMEKVAKLSNKDAWKNFMDEIPEPTYDPSKSKFERTPSLILEIGPTYKLKMADLGNIPNPQMFEGKYGTHAKTPFKVYLIGVSDSMLYEQVYTKGEFKGQKAFVNGQKYTLWMDDNCKRAWKYFFLKLNDDGLPDDREFTFRWTKKGNKNQWHFGLPK